MQYKIDTKEKFHVIIPEMEIFSEKMADDLVLLVNKIAETVPHNVIVNCCTVKQFDLIISEKLITLRADMYEKNRSFVMCAFDKPIYEHICANALDEALNVTPTESEAWDIVQMDEIEREFMNDVD